MSNKITTIQYIKKAHDKHGNKYLYDRVNYIGSSYKVIITCPNHGDFSMRANAHIQGQGCRECSLKKLAEDKSDTTEQFIEKAKQVHGDKYKYCEVVYKNAHCKIKIICKEHGIFEQKPNNHLQGQGCRDCRNQKSKLKIDEFIKDSNNVHKNKYDYSKVVYKRSDEKVIIICPEHGEFYQTPSNHKLGKGCIKCAHEYVKQINIEAARGWSYSDWQKAGEKSKNFDSFKVYIIRCWNDEEEFYKIGRTYNTIKRRFGSTLMPYNYEVIKIYKGKAKEMCKLEHVLKNKSKENKYTPNIPFSGKYECFKTINI